MTARFRVLENVALADAAFEASGDTPSELCQAAAQALIDTMVDPRSVEPTWTKTIALHGPDLSDLLFDWLSELVYLKDAEAVLFRQALPTVEEGAGGAEWRLVATVTGAPIDPQRQELRADVKAVTKHLYEVRQDGGRWVARVVVDI
jgi:SHS2 domain-containing protein